MVTELSQQSLGHTIHSRIFKSQGFSKLAEKYAEHAEEIGFVEKCIDRLIDLGCEVKLESKAEGSVKDPVEYIKYDFSLSRNEEGLALMKEVIALAMVEDYTSYDILKDYMQDEDEGANWMEEQLELIELIGKQNWLVHQL
ncbi:MAG TPA: bacterioferritin (cytochrome b1) [Kandleria vitulina]|nr:bacterioferritin (cytochrome b1) [Kandleria vitulina]